MIFSRGGKSYVRLAMGPWLRPSNGCFLSPVGICSADEERESVYTLVDVYEFSWAQGDSVTSPESQNLLFSN